MSRSRPAASSRPGGGPWCLLPLLALALGCGPPTFAPHLDVDLEQMTRTPSGLYYQDLTVGEGAEAVDGAYARVHYEGWLPDGLKFDENLPPDPPFSFWLGAGQVIAGWDEGVLGMKVGGVRKLVVPPELGYGSDGSGPLIPPGATLVFDVQLFQLP